MNIDEILMENEPLIRYIANKFYNVETDDLLQAGRMGLLKAYEKYDASRNVKFSSFAYKSIFGEMHELMQKDNLINLNREYIQVGKKIRELSNNFFLNTGRYPTTHELALELGLSSEFVSEVIIMSSSIKSLDDEASELDLHEVIPSVERDITTDILVKDAIESLPSPEKEIMLLRCYGDYSQEEVAKKLGLSQVKVSRCEKSGKDKMREYARVA